MRTCPSCGSENPDGARFCNDCGRALGASPGAREVRKTVTVLFADVTDSTALGEQLDPESLRRVMARYFDVGEGRRSSATGARSRSSSAMPSWRCSACRPCTRTMRCVRCAPRRSCATRSRSLNEELERDFGVSLAAAHRASTPARSSTGTEERLATGDAVNVAARLEQAAPPGEILIGEQTCRLARAAIEVEPVEPLALKGKAESLRRLPAAAGRRGCAAPSTARSTLRLVGRRDELAALASGVRRPPSPSGAASSSRCSARRDRQVASRRASSSRDGRRRGDGRVRPLPSLRRGHHLLAAREIFARGGRRGRARRDARSRWRRKRSSGQSARRSRRLARERPLALVVEDIHWAEPTLLDLSSTWRTGRETLRSCSSASPGRSCSIVRPGWGGRPAETITLEPLSASRVRRS